MTNTLVFSHGNGFPAGTYRQLFEVWRAAGWRVLAIDKYGHDPRYPVSSNWPRLRDQLVDFVAEHAPGGAFLVGHSLGGLLSLMAASRRPELARGVVMLDSPLISGWRARGLHLLKASRLISRVSPGRMARRRRVEWPSQHAVAEHYRHKPVFARWAPGVLDDYIASGTEPRNGGVALAFDRAVETHIYDTLPHHLGTLLARAPLHCPLGVIAGTRSEEMRLGGVGAARALAGERFVWIEGSHLYPMENPDQAARAVLALLASMPVHAVDPAQPAARPGEPQNL